MYDWRFISCHLKIEIFDSTTGETIKTISTVETIDKAVRQAMEN